MIQVKPFLSITILLVSPQAKWLFKIAQQCRAVKLGLDVVALGPAGHCPDEPGSKVESATESRASVAAKVLCLKPLVCC